MSEIETDAGASTDGAPEGELQSSPVRLALLAGGIVALGVLGGLPILIVVLAIIVMIFLHELGHYLTAKWAGMKVTEFFLGFGPRIWSFRRGETEYGVKAIWVGAYVRIIGMHNLDEVDPADESRTYRQQPFWQRFSVAVAGSTMHFLIALTLLFVVFVGFGEPNEAAWTVDRVTPSGDIEVRGEPVDSPADEAGLRAGDRVVELDGVAIQSFQDLRAAVEARPDQDVDLVVQRDGETVELSTTLVGLPDGNEELGFLGVNGDIPLRRLGPVQAAGRAGSQFGTMASQAVAGLGHFFSPDGLTDFGRQFGDSLAGETDPEPSDDQGAPSNEGGENRIVSIVGATRIGGQATEAGVVTFLSFLAVINIFIGMFNLVPLLPLDGGHVAIATYEKFREWRAGNGQRYFVDVARLLPTTYAFVFVLISISLMAVYLDFANPINLPTR